MKSGHVDPLPYVPKSSFEVYRSEGDVYFRRFRFLSAIDAYSKVKDTYFNIEYTGP